MKTSFPASDVLRPFTQVLTDTFIALVDAYGGVQRLNDALARSSARKVSIGTLYRWYSAAQERRGEINMSHVGKMLEVLLLVPSPDTNAEPICEKLSKAILNTNNQP